MIADAATAGHRAWQADGMTRSPETIQREIEQTREQLASTLDQLAERASPKRLAERSRERAAAAATSPAGLGVIGGFALLTTLLVVRRVRRRRAR
jgi:hypothetical protein